MDFKKFILTESIDYKGMSDDDFFKWILSLKVTKRTPQGVNKVDHGILSTIVQLAQKVDHVRGNKFADISIEMFAINGKLKNIRMSKEEIDSFYSGGKGKDTTIKETHATYIKLDSVSYDKFLINIKNIEKFLGTLKGFHKKALGNLKIRFVDASEQKSIAKYLSSFDIIQINSKKVGNTEDGYGSMVYVLLHELGHRYLKHHPQGWDYDNKKWITTVYSKTDSMTGEEKFAELFAMSHWEDKYKQFKDLINEFENILE